MNLSNSKIKSAAADFIEMMIYCICNRISDLCESPIEKTLFESIMAYRWCHDGKLPYVVCKETLEWDGHWRITPQAQIDKYRADFLIEDTDCNVKAVVECDGHDFHERTKEQARKDRSRDRDMQAQGYLVLRYTGSEIWRDPWSCVEDIEQKIWEFSRNREPS